MEDSLFEKNVVPDMSWEEFLALKQIDWSNIVGYQKPVNNATLNKVFAQTSIPTSLAVGDIWFDTDDNNKLYRVASVGANTIATGQWEAMPDTGLTLPVTGYVKGGQTDYHTGTGFFLGYSGAAYKFSVGNPSGNYISWDGSTLTVNGYELTSNVRYAAGDLLLYSDDTEVSTGSVSYILKKQAILPRAGVLRIKFDIATTNATYATYGRIYRNGVAVGTEHYKEGSTDYETFSEDISDWSRGDLVQIYIHGTTGPMTALVKNFRIYANAPDIITTVAV